MIYTRPLCLVLISLATVLVISSVSKYQTAIASNDEAKTLAEAPLFDKQKALLESISSALSLHNKRNTLFTSKPCFATLDNEEEVTLSGIDIATYHCEITDQHGAVYAAEVDLTFTAGKVFAMPAFLTEIDNEEIL